TSDQIQMIKPKLSCFVVDTSKCYHMGSRLQKEHKRLLYTALYIGLPSVYPWGGQEKYTLVNSSLTPLQTMALINQ
ncbi:MAG: hypothetical protein ACOYOK_12945, partial [Pseudobdellovibrionaceae bacterium]